MGYMGETESLLICQFASCLVHTTEVSEWFEMVNISCYIMLLFFFFERNEGVVVVLYLKVLLTSEQVRLKSRT